MKKLTIDYVKKHKGTPEFLNFISEVANNDKLRYCVYRLIYKYVSSDVSAVLKNNFNTEDKYTYTKQKLGLEYLTEVLEWIETLDGFNKNYFTNHLKEATIN